MNIVLSLWDTHLSSELLPAMPASRRSVLEHLVTSKLIYLLDLERDQ